MNFFLQRRQMCLARTSGRRQNRGSSLSCSAVGSGGHSYFTSWALSCRISVGSSSLGGRRKMVIRYQIKTFFPDSCCSSVLSPGTARYGDHRCRSHYFSDADTEISPRPLEASISYYSNMTPAEKEKKAFHHRLCMQKITP